MWLRVWGGVGLAAKRGIMGVVGYYGLGPRAFRHPPAASKQVPPDLEAFLAG
jgi:hypothetical protein